MAYEDLLKITGADRLEAVDEQMKMLSPSDVGRRAYREITRIYARFGETGAVADFEAVAEKLAAVTGYRI